MSGRVEEVRGSYGFAGSEIDGLVKSRKCPSSVIPVKTGMPAAYLLAAYFHFEGWRIINE
jgi:hypothetical protein